MHQRICLRVLMAGDRPWWLVCVSLDCDYHVLFTVLLESQPCVHVCLHKLGQSEDRKSLFTCLSDCNVSLQKFLHANTLKYDKHNDDSFAIAYMSMFLSIGLGICWLPPYMLSSIFSACALIAFPPFFSSASPPLLSLKVLASICLEFVFNLHLMLI